MIDYGPLWITMEKKGVSQYKLMKSGIDYRTMDQLRNNKNITAKTLEKLCTLLECTPNDVITFKPDKDK
ncbi:helix-turn-helix domain-containing protein [Hespellia stercorisuis]|uniref:DNA-binding transcriptional regulator, XRE family n=1 Tax=Hespellia stercorisuis DSM 15480 TaxID=1121950 RepID=A0A1M6TKR3_9FIRM|nr:helix-turn-helix domain-containing protein [Hespellia stercorisuis]SHK57486.1 DNA-binding transcriptional regulator, XRE family [Hespellia stercorisuis DSM 15480]